MKSTLVAALFVVSVAAVLAQSERDAIRNVLNDQVIAWNEGDIERYMEGYWNSGETIFLSGGNLSRGYQEVLARYRKAYDSREKMGTLSFRDLTIQMLGLDVAVVSGVWSLIRKKDNPWGRFTLIVERKPEGWRITHDHTSTHQE